MSKFASYPQFLFLFFLFFSIQSNAQEASGLDKKADLKNAMMSMKFYFQARFAKPVNGGNLLLWDEYFLQISHDSLMVNLPYYDYYFTTNEYDESDYPIEFTTTQFTYAADSIKRGGWKVTVVPSGQDLASKISLSITSSGYCNMYVTSIRRNAMTFYGEILALKD